MAPENKLALIKGHFPQGSELPVSLDHSPGSSAPPAKPLLCRLPLPHPRSGYVAFRSSPRLCSHPLRALLLGSPWSPPGRDTLLPPAVPGHLLCSPVDIPSQRRMPCPDQMSHAPHCITCHCNSHTCPCCVTTVSPAPRAGPGTYESVNIQQLVRGQKGMMLKCRLNCHLALPQA